MSFTNSSHVAGYKVCVAGRKGMAGSAILRRLGNDDSAQITIRAQIELDLTDQSAVERFSSDGLSEYVFLAAAKVGRWKLGQQDAACRIHENIGVQSDVIRAAHRFGVRRLLFLG